MRVGFENTAMVMSQGWMAGDRDGERDNLGETRLWAWKCKRANSVYMTKPEVRTRAGLEAQKA